MASSNTTLTDEVQTNSKTRVLFASLVGTTIEFFDFYIYATAAVIIFPHLFFPASTIRPQQRFSLLRLSPLPLLHVQLVRLYLDI